MSSASDVVHHVVRVPATSANLGPGFDAYGLALRRHLIVESRPRHGSGVRVLTVGQGAGELPTGSDNLIWRSMVDACERWDVELPEVDLHVVNDIPPERGLGSSSSAIVAGLVMARALTGAAVSDRQIVEAAAALEGHPDNVAPAVLGGLVACVVGDDGRLIVRRVAPAPALRVLACVPAQRQATGEARAIVPDRLDRDEVVAQAARSGHVIGALAGWWAVDAMAVGDRLHEPPRLEAMPQAGALIRTLRDQGVHAWLSGAGPTVAAAVNDEATADLVAEASAHNGFESHEWGIDLAGAIACAEGRCAIAAGGTCVQCPRNAV